jgi:hypothetical protein
MRKKFGARALIFNKLLVDSIFDTSKQYNDKIASQLLLMALRKLEGILGGKKL